MFIIRRYNKVIYVWKIAGILQIIDPKRQETPEHPLKINIHEFDEFMKENKKENQTIFEIK